MNWVYSYTAHHTLVSVRLAFSKQSPICFLTEVTGNGRLSKSGHKPRQQPHEKRHRCSTRQPIDSSTWQKYTSQQKWRTNIQNYSPCNIFDVIILPPYALLSNEHIHAHTSAFDVVSTALAVSIVARSSPDQLWCVTANRARCSPSIHWLCDLAPAYGKRRSATRAKFTDENVFM